MNIGGSRQDLFRKLDSNGNGVSLGELKALDTNQDGEFSTAEAQAAGLSNPQDQNLINKTYQRAVASDLQLETVLFDRDAEDGFKPTETPGDRLSYGAFDPFDPSIAQRLTRLDQSLASTGNQVLNPAGFQWRPAPDPKGIARLDVYSDQVRAMQSFDDLKGTTQSAVTSFLTQQLGQAPTDAQVKAYIEANGGDMAQQLGADLSGKYSDWTSVGLAGDVNTMHPFQSSGPEDKNIVVCTNIHAAVAAYRQEVLGQEAYIMHSNGNDQAHIVTVFKDNATQTWNIQNYGRVVETDAKDIRQLFDQYLPDQRHIVLASVNQEGLKSERDVRTAIGEREHRFRSQLGAGNHNPQSPQNSMDLGNQRLNLNLGKWNLNYDPQLETLAVNRHTQQQDGNRLRTTGFGIEAQDHTNAQGFQRQRVDAKYERESIRLEQPSSSHEQRTRQYFNVHAGLEQTSNAMPIYQADTAAELNSDHPAAARAGVFYSWDQNNLYGQQPLRFELGHQVNLGVTGTVATGGDDWAISYANRMLGDATAEYETRLGLNYQSGPLQVRAGLTPRLDLANINGISNFGKQANQVFELDAYSEITYQGERGRVSAMGTADLRHPGVFKVGAMAELNLKDDLSWATTVMHNNDPLLGNQTGMMTGLNYTPAPGISIYGNLGSDLNGQMIGGAGLRINLDRSPKKR